MNLAERIQTDLVEAMRAKDELRLSVLRGIKSAIKLKEVEKIRALDESESIQILQTLVKQRKESIEQFTKGNRPELAAKETKELGIIESYLPAGASEADMDAAISKAISETGAKPHRLPSGPLHDAAEVARAGVPTVMMFVQSLHGISHNKIEDTKEEHLELCVAAFDKLAEKAMGWIQSR